MNEAPLLYDLFCGAGGAAEGYRRAGFRVVGVDDRPQPRYRGDGFLCMDVFEFFRLYEAGEFAPADAFHASPPCQPYGTFANVNRARGRGEPKQPKLVEPVREKLRAAGLPYVIENTERAPLLNPVKLCGSSFGLRVRRHRLFESNVVLFGQPCRHRGHRSWDYVGVYGSRPGGGFKGADRYERTRRAASLEEAREAMGVDWMIWEELTQAIPPAYTHYLGSQLVDFLRRGERAA